MSARSCTEVRADLSAYLDGDLDAALTAATRIHLDGCAACRAELGLLRLTVGALHRLPDLPPPVRILSGVRARLQPEPWYRRLLVGRRWHLGAPLGALATLLVIVGISLFQARYPDLPKTVPQTPIPKAPAPPAREMPAKPTPAAMPSSAARDIVANRQAAPSPQARVDLRLKGAPDSAQPPRGAFGGEGASAPALPRPVVSDKKDRYQGVSSDLAAVERKFEQSRPAPAGLQSAAQKAALRVEAPPVESVAAAPSGDHGAAVLDELQGTIGTSSPATGKKKESLSFAAREADSGAGPGQTKVAEEKAAATGVRIVCLLPPDGVTVDELTRLLRGEGAARIEISALQPPAVRDAFAPYRRGRGSLPEPSRGWAVTASVPPHALAPLLDALSRRDNLRILEQPPRLPTAEDATEPLDLRITVFR